MAIGIIVVIVIVALLVITTIAKSIKIVPQARAGVVERLGRFTRVLDPGLALLVPFFDRVRAMIDLREQVVSFPPQPVITEDNLTVNIDTVVYFQVNDPRAATYEIANYIQAVEQLTITTLRNVVGGMNLEATLTSRDEINMRLRGELDEATGPWGIRVARVELKAIEPPASIQDSMEKQMRADRDKRAMILQAEGARESAIKTAEGQKASQILSAEGQKQGTILTAEADRQSRILRAEGERAARYLSSQGQAKAIETVFASIHAANPDPKLLAYQYLQMLPEIAKGDANKMWIVPSEFSKALEGLGGLGSLAGAASGGESGGGNGAAAAANANWLAEAGAGPAAAPIGTTDLDASSWFDSNLPPVAIEPESFRASDADPDTAVAHEGLAEGTGSVTRPAISIPKPEIPDRGRSRRVGASPSGTAMGDRPETTAAGQPGAGSGGQAGTDDDAGEPSGAESGGTQAPSPYAEAPERVEDPRFPDSQYPGR